MLANKHTFLSIFLIYSIFSSVLISHGSPVFHLSGTTADVRLVHAVLRYGGVRLEAVSVLRRYGDGSYPRPELILLRRPGTRFTDMNKINLKILKRLQLFRTCFIGSCYSFTELFLEISFFI